MGRKAEGRGEKKKKSRGTERKEKKRRGTERMEAAMQKDECLTASSWRRPSLDCQFTTATNIIMIMANRHIPTSQKPTMVGF